MKHPPVGNRLATVGIRPGSELGDISTNIQLIHDLDLA